MRGSRRTGSKSSSRIFRLRSAVPCCWRIFRADRSGSSCRPRVWAQSAEPGSSFTRFRRNVTAGEDFVRRRLVPSIADLLFLAIFIWLFAGASGWSQLLADGDTGWHIRNGQLILQNHSIPYRDWFGFGSEAHPWFAWEWLADVLFALLHRAAGLKAVVFFCGVVIAATQYVVFRHCL